MGSEKSAISRSVLSAPARYIEKHHFWDEQTAILDYGCGKGADANHLDTARYDPFYFPNPTSSKYYIILCTYVLNVVDEPTQVNILKDIQNLLYPGGIAFISIRRDIPKGVTEIKGKEYSQRYVTLDATTYHKTNNYETYIITKEWK